MDRRPGRRPRAELADIDALFTQMSDQPPTTAQIVSVGMPGGPEQKLLTTLHRRGGKSETAAAAAAVSREGAPFQHRRRPTRRSLARAARDGHVLE